MFTGQKHSVTKFVSKTMLSTNSKGSSFRKLKLLMSWNTIKHTLQQNTEVFKPLSNALSTVMTCCLCNVLWPLYKCVFKVLPKALGLVLYLVTR